ncbi:MAG TPA: hypothetical protein VEA69_02855, partial [Tepidisphaeraceae bacterium]|nr:hypothetical protein [Tepidisphaeraceae bacterium]
MAHAQDYVTGEVVDLKLALVHQKLDTLLATQEQILAQQKLTNGKVQRHERMLTRLWAIGATAWAALG